MPRTVPAELIELEGRSSQRNPILLMEWHLVSGTRYFSSGERVEWNGQIWEANRLTAPSVTFGIIDRDNREFPKITLQMENLPDNGSTAFPFQAIDATEVFEDKLVILYIYSPEKKVAAEFWQGRSIRPSYNGSDNTCTISLSFIFDSLNMPAPTKGLPQAGFNTTGVEQNKDGLNEDSTIPLYYGVGEKKIRPVVYRFEVNGAFAYVDFIVSGCAAGLPFDADDLLNLKLFDTIKPLDIVFRPGGVDTVPHNLTKFPDGLAHDNVAYGFALYPWTNEQKQNGDTIKSNDVRGTIANGRPLIDTGLPSENLPLIIKDLLRDPEYGLGAPDADFDNDVLAETAAYIGTRYQARLELLEQKPMLDLLQRLLGECHCYITWANGKIQIRAKRNDETASATFASIDSGHAGILIEDHVEDVSERGFDEIPNQLKVEYRQANRHEAEPFYIRDPNAQAYAGQTYKKVSQDEIELIAIFDIEQAKISAGIRLREDLQGDIYIKFRTPFYDSLRTAHGDCVDAFDPRITNNASNYRFRVLTETFDFGEVPFREFYCKLYKPAIYNDDYEGLEIDLERTNTDTTQSGRPDDVVPVSLEVSDPVDGDTGGKLITIKATCTIPADDRADEIAAGITGEPPVAAWEPWYRYTDESPNLWRRGTTIEVAQQDAAFNSEAEFQIDFYKNRSVEVAFVVLPPSRAKSKLGYIPDPAHHSTIAGGSLSAIDTVAGVADSTPFAGATYVICEREIDKLISAAGNVLTFEADGDGRRKPYFETSAIAHPNETQISVAKLSYPSLTISLTPPRFTYGTVQNLVGRQRDDGVRFHWDDVGAENQEKYFLYWSTDTDAGTNILKLGSAAPAWYATDPKTPPAGVNLIITDAFSVKVIQELIGAAGTTVYARVAARNGKNNYSAALSNLASNKLGDDAVPSLATQPTLVPRQIGLRVKCPLPTLNMKTFSTSGKVEIVLQARDGANAVLGYVSVTGSDYSTQIGEYKFDIGLAHTNQFNIKKGDLLALWPTIVSLKVYFYVTNAVGTSAASPVSSLTVATWEADAMQIDTAVPSGLNTPVLHAQKGSFVAKKMYATTNDNQEQYKEVVFAVVDDLGALINYVDAVNRTSTASEATAKINVGTSGHYTLQMRADEMIAAFGGPTNRNLKVYYYVSNLLGPSLKSTDSAGIAFANFKADPVEKDTTVPTIPAAPTVIPSAAKIKCNTKPPTSQIAVLVKVEIVARVKNGGTILGYIIDGTVPTNNATEFKNDNGLHFKDTFNWKRADIIALYPTATAIEFYSYVTNEIGTSAASAAASLNVSTWEVDPPGDDITAPSGITAPIIKRLKKAGLRIRLIAPTAGNLKLRQANVYIANGAHGVATLFVGASDLTTPTATEANGAIDALAAGGQTITVDRATLESIFGIGATITVYATWTNDIGTSGFSSGSTYNLAAGEAAAVDQDTAVPSSLSVATLVYIPRQGVHIENLRVNDNWNTPNDKWVVIYDNAGNYFDLPAYLSSGGATVRAASSELVARYRIGPGKNHAPFAIKLRDLKTVFGFGNPTNIYAYFYAGNGVGTSSKSTDSAALNLFGAKDIMGATDGVRVLDVAATMMSPANLLGNGDVLLIDNSNDEVYNWARWDGLVTPLPSIGSTGFKVITSTSAEIAYVSTTDSLWLKANSSWQLLQTLKKRLKAGQSYTQTFLLRAASAITVTVKLHLYNLSRPALTGTMNLTSSINCVGTGTLAGTEFVVGDYIVVSGQRRKVATITDALHWTVDAAFSAASGAMNVIIDNINNTISQSIQLTTDYQIFLATISMKNSPNLASTPGGTDYTTHYFGLEITSNTQDIYEDYFMLVRGQQQMMFAPRGDENDNFNIGVVPTFISTPDVVSISGTQGGSFAKDSGGLISPQ
jgi:hypothetical protein